MMGIKPTNDDIRIYQSRTGLVLIHDDLISSRAEFFLACVNYKDLSYSQYFDQ